jgi:hypothetical protein
MSSRLLGGAAVAVLVLLAAACGGGGGNPTTSTAAGGTSAESQIRQAGRDFDRATKTLTQSLKQLGTPETAQGQAAKKNLDTLVTTLDNGTNKIDDALSSSGGVLSQISTISATLATMAGDLKLAGANLNQLAPSSELQQAFHQAGSCKQYVH